jgi:hypothetical protein
MECIRIILSSDCLDVVINILKEGGNSLGIAAAIIEDCYQLATEFAKVIFEHSYREANSVAHELVRVARSSTEQVWLNDPPEFIS